MADYPSDPNERSLPRPSSYGIPAYYDISQSNGYAGYGGQDGDSKSVEYNRAQGAAAFGYNSTFPFFSPATVASGIPPLPIFQDWHPASFSSVSEQHYQPEIPESSRQAARSQDLLNDNSQSSPFNARLPRFLAASIPVEQPVEEGEVSEGEFEEGRPESASINRGGLSFDGELDPQAMVQPDQSTDVYGRSLDLNKQRSPSYSPYASPVQNSYDIPPVTQARSYDDYVEPAYENVYPNNDNRQVNRGSRSGFVEYPKDVRADMSSTSIPLAGLASARVRSIEPHAIKIKSVREARKEAQNAILNLWPLKVRFQNYLEEGIDEEIVRRQFEDLGMPQGSTHLVQQEENLQLSLIAEHDVEPVRGDNYWNSSTLPHKQVGLDRSSKPVNGPGSLESKSENIGEAEKDLVARLPSERAVLSAPSAPGNLSARSTSPDLSATAKSSSTTQLTAKAEKERLLKQKMDNLQKSREARALKAAAKAVTAPTIPAASKAISPTPAHIDPSIPPPLVAAPSIAELPPSNLSLSRSSSPHPLKNTQRIVPPIPGLFLSVGTTASPISQFHLNGNPQTVNQRKRPVASDFDAPSTTTLCYKRPFGQNRTEEPLVIDVSDDESEDDVTVPMDIDEPVVSSPAQGGKNVPNPTRATAIRDLPPLSDFPPRRPFIPSSSALNTPPTPQPAANEDLQSKEMQIQEMKRKIADFERRQKAKQSQSGSQTPSRTETTVASESRAARGSSVPDKVEPSNQIEQMVDNTSCNVEGDRQNPPETHVMEQPKTDDVNRREAEQKRLRKARIAADLPVVDAQVLKSQQRLSDLRAEMKLLEIAVQKGLADKQKLAEEMEALEHDVEKQPHEQVEKLGELDHEVLGNGEAIPPAPFENSHVHPIRDSKSPLRTIEITETTESSPLQIIPLAGEENLNSATPITDAPGTSTLPALYSESFCDSAESEKAASAELDLASPVTGSEILEVTAIDASAKEESAGTTVEAEPPAASEVEMINTHPPRPLELVESLSSAASSMHMKESELTDSNHGHGFADHGDTESDLYEPHDATPSVVVEPSSESPPFSPAPPQVDSGSIGTDIQPASVSAGHSLNTVLEIPSELIISLPALPNESNVEINPVYESRFTPYESVLKQLHTYRFNSSFAREVPGGYKSMTYSNNIKDDQELCRFELAGGVCNDATCEFQHFRTMGLADDAILVELGNSAGYNDEEKPKFVAGLRTVLQDLRTRKIKDFQVIASEIAAFRARFSASS